MPQDPQFLYTVDILDVGLCDHRLLRWTSHLHRPPPVYTSTSCRSWRSFDADVFLADLQSSSLCDERQWQGLNGDALAELYDKAISELLDHQVPVQLIIYRRRTTSTWFDDDYMFSHDIPQVHYPSNSSVDSLQVSPVPSVLRPHSLFASLSLI